MAALLTSILKTSEIIEFKIQPGEGRVGVGGSRTGCGECRIDGNRIDGSEVRDDEVGKKFKNCLSPKICLKRR